MPKSPVTAPLSEERVLGNRNQHTPAQIADTAEQGLKPTPRAYQIPLARLKPWAIQPRQDMDAESLRELANSIAVSGVLEPLVVRRDPAMPGDYLLIAGHRRLAAAQIVSGDDDLEARRRVATLPCLVRDLDDAAAYALSLVENLQRKDLSAHELLDAVLHLNQVYGWRKARIARETGRNDSYIGRLINIGQHLRLRPLVAGERLSPTAAGHILRLSASGQDILISRLEKDASVTLSVADVLRSIDNEEAGRAACDDGIIAGSIGVSEVRRGDLPSDESSISEVDRFAPSATDIEAQNELGVGQSSVRSGTDEKTVISRFLERQIFPSREERGTSVPLASDVQPTDEPGEKTVISRFSETTTTPSSRQERNGQEGRTVPVTAHERHVSDRRTTWAVEVERAVAQVITLLSDTHAPDPASLRKIAELVERAQVYLDMHGTN